MFVRVLATAIVIAGVAGCATSRDIRKLQVQIDEVRDAQRGLEAHIARIDSINATEVSGARTLAVDLKHSLADVTDRLDHIDARLVDLDQRAVQPMQTTPSSPQVIPELGASTVPAESAVTNVTQPDRQATYQAAYDAMAQEDYPAAVALFREYVTDAPQAPEAGAALYWIGECFAADGQTDSAIAEFQKIVDMYPQNDKVPAALFRIGNLYEEKDDKQSAFPYYQRLRQEYPQSLEYQLLRRKLGE